MNDDLRDEHDSESESVLAEVVSGRDKSEWDDDSWDNQDSTDDDDLVLVAPSRRPSDEPGLKPDEALAGLAADSETTDLDNMLQRLDALSGVLESGDTPRPDHRRPAAGPLASVASVKPGHRAETPLDGTRPTTIPNGLRPSLISAKPADRRTRLADDLNSLRQSARQHVDDSNTTRPASIRRLTTRLVLASVATATSTLLLLLCGSTGTWTYFGGVVATAASVFWTLRFLNEGKRLLATDADWVVE